MRRLKLLYEERFILRLLLEIPRPVTCAKLIDEMDRRRVSTQRVPLDEWSVRRMLNALAQDGYVDIVKREHNDPYIYIGLLTNPELDEADVV